MASPDPFTAPTVTVRGEGVLRAELDEAMVFVTLRAGEGDAGRAVAEVSRRSEALIALLDELGVAKRERSTSGLGVAEEFDYSAGGRRSLGYRASVSMGVRLTDRTAIGRLVTSATTELGAEVSGPHWQIAAANPVRLQAARAAAANARQKAEAFADGIGAKVGRVVRLVEAGTQTGVPVYHRAVAASAPLAGQPMPIEAGEHEVSAAVDVTFLLELS